MSCSAGCGPCRDEAPRVVRSPMSRANRRALVARSADITRSCIRRWRLAGSSGCFHAASLRFKTVDARGIEWSSDTAAVATGASPDFGTTRAASWTLIEE